MPESPDAAREGVSQPSATGPQAASRPGALSPAELERLADKVYRLAAAETRLASARGQSPRLPDRGRP